MKMQIRRRVLVMMLACSIGGILVAIGLSMYGMFGVKSTAINTGQTIGETAANDSTQALEKQAQEHLESTAQDKAIQIEHILDLPVSEATMFSREMTEIMQHPELYPAVQIPEPSAFDTGILPYVMYAPGVNRAAVQN